jgi:hypothetical protein
VPQHRAIQHWRMEIGIVIIILRVLIDMLNVIVGIPW